jgi:hypothetical protein
LIAVIGQLEPQAQNPRHRANLAWLAANLEFILLLDEVGRKIEPAYDFKNQLLLGQSDSKQLASRIERARIALEAAPIEELFETYAGRVRSRGELGVLSSLNQKLWLQYKEIDYFLNTVAPADTLTPALK